MNESLAGLRNGFNEWRKKRVSVTERVPEDLRSEVESAVKVHGVSRVARATGLSTSWFSAQRKRKVKVIRATGLPVPPYSRVELIPPVVRSSPVAEAETARGMKLRIYSITPESTELLSSFCRAGGMA
jgi:hypothetical protein